MDKDLSKKLCELCGIKPKFFALMQSEENWEEIPESVYYKIKDCSTTKIIYPDFTKPENFVRLLEIVSRRSSVSFCHNGSYFGCSIHYYFNEIFEADIGNIQYNFLNTLLKQDLRNPCKPKLLEQLKQSIREAEWVYE